VFQATIRRHITLTQELAALARHDDRFEIVAPHPLNLLCVSLVAGDAATDDLIERANASGEVLFTRTVLDSRSVLRFSIGGRTTEQRHVLAGWDLLSQLAGSIR
jgi:aromatic-L-amino-acid/L-tryptophan decarboxylase